MRTVRKSATYTVAVHFSQCVPYSWLQTVLQPTWKAWMGLPLQQSVTQDMSGSARPPAGYHALMLAVNAFMPPAVNVFMQAGSTLSCVGKRCVVSALTRCVANINQTFPAAIISWIAPARQKCTALRTSMRARGASAVVRAPQ